MVKLLFLCRRLPTITHDVYTTRLLDGHVPIALRHHPTLRRYAVNIVDTSLPGAPPLDSVGALWFDSLGDFRERLYDSSAGERIVADDVRGFLGGADAYVTTERVQRSLPKPAALGRRTPGVKLIVAVRRPATESHEQFVRHWLERHAPLVLSDPGVCGYVINLVETKLDAKAPDYDGIAELWFESAEDFDRHVRLSRDENHPIGADVRRLVGAASPYLVSEYVER